MALCCLTVPKWLARRRRRLLGSVVLILAWSLPAWSLPGGLIAARAKAQRSPWVAALDAAADDSFENEYVPATGLGLAEVVTRTLARAPEIQAAAAAVAGAKAQARGAQTRWFPDVTLQAFITRLGAFGATSQRDRDSVIPDPTTGTVQPFVFFPTRGGLIADVRYSLTHLLLKARPENVAATAGVDASHAGVEQARVQLAAIAAEAFVSLAAADARSQFAAAEVARARRRADLLKQQALSGRSAESDVLFQRAEVLNAEAELEEALGERAQARALLGLLAGLREGESVAAAIGALGLPPDARSSSRAPDTPEVRERLAAARVADAQAHGALSDVVPNVYVGAGLQVANPNFQIAPVQEEWATAWHVEAGISWDVGDAYRRHAQRRQSEADALRLRADAGAAQARAERDIAVFEAQAQALDRVQKSRRQRFEALLSVRRAARLRFESGRGSLFEVIAVEGQTRDAYRATLEAAAGRDRAQIAARVASGRLPVPLRE